jgi:hypothetical protein
MSTDETVKNNIGNFSSAFLMASLTHQVANYVILKTQITDFLVDIFRQMPFPVYTKAAHRHPQKQFSLCRCGNV